MHLVGSAPGSPLPCCTAVATSSLQLDVAQIWCPLAVPHMPERACPCFLRLSLQVSSRGESEQRARDLAAAEAEIADLRRQLEAQKQAAASAAADPAPRPAAKRGRKKVNGTAATAVEVEHISASQAADAAVAAAKADAAAAQQRAIEIRAEAAMLVETVEDRAHEVRCLMGGCCRDRQGAGECMQPLLDCTPAAMHAYAADTCWPGRMPPP